MNFTHLLNRLTPTAAADGWVHVCPLGEHPWKSPDGKQSIIQVIDNEACQLMAASYPLSEEDSMWDWEHESVTPAGSTRASGWGKETQVRNDGLWLRVDWTPEGLKDVEGKVYRFCSPCFPRDGAVDLGNGRFRMTQVSRVALTNNPNLRGQTPLTNAAEAANPNTPKTMDYKALLLKLLGLPPEATDEQITTAQASCSPEKASAVANAARVAELQTQLSNSDLDNHGITDAKQRALLAPLLTNSATRADTLALIKGKTVVQQPQHMNRGAKVPNPDVLQNKGDEDQAAKDREFNAAVLDYRNSKSCTHQAAHNYITAKWQAEGKL